MNDLKFISEKNLTKHVKETIRQYGDNLKSYDLKRFNNNLIDPIKLIFDKNVYRTSWKGIIENEIFRQRDKSNNNVIGYFHQNIFLTLTVVWFQKKDGTSFSQIITV